MYYIVVGGTQNNYYADRDNVRFFSFVSQKQMARIYELSDCVITRA
jgi:UDP-N-acetylglucosamine:LPS N-acetylglucosamine transferase